ncbi:MAG TPA: GNAT family N-acetyltransferase [Burkholderiaceae bacterium]|nr:GNAT family N-acetyltransferase [Burkholderiaceae bacterium]
MTIITGSWRALAPHARPIRLDVFVREQHVPVELEWDGIDEQCTHAIAYDAHGQPVGTGRLVPDGHIGRMAVLKNARGQGHGGRILEALVALARSRGHREVVLSAQTHARDFYERHGFVARGDEYLDADIAHIEMRRLLAP